MATNGFYFAKPNGGGYLGAATPGYGDFQAVNQANGFEEPLGKYGRLYPGFGSGNAYGAAPGAGGSAWGFAPISTNTTTTHIIGAGGVPNTAGAQLLQTDKFPAVNDALNAALGRVNSDGTGVVSSIRDPAQANRVATAGASLDASQAGQNESLADFTKNYLSGDSTAKGFQASDTAALDKWYAGSDDPNSVQGTLDRLVRQRHQAVQGAVGRALDRAQRGANLSRLGMGGNSAYANAQFNDAAAGIYANEAQQEADLNRSNYQAVLAGQQQNAGVRAKLFNDYLMRGLTPIQAAQSVQSGQLSNLGLLGQIGAANRIDRTQQQLTAEQIQNILAVLTGKNNANISGVGANYQTPNYPNVPRLPYGGGYGDPNLTPTYPTYPTLTAPPSIATDSYFNRNWLVGDDPVIRSGSLTPPPMYSNRGTGTGGFGDQTYIPGVGYVPNSDLNQGYDAPQVYDTTA